MSSIHTIPIDTFFSLEKFLDVQRNFEYKTGETPLSDWRWPVGISTGYLLTIFILRQIIKRPLPVKLLSALHNFNMLIISIACFIGQLYGLYDILTRTNWDIETLYCDPRQSETLKGPLYFWIYLFYLSKFYELVDTLMLVFKNSRLRFLHVYHHWATGLLCFCCLMDSIPIQWIATVLNAGVHIPMYYYYFVIDLNPKAQIWWKRYITQMQIAQFITVNIVHWSAIGAAYIRGDCIGYNTIGNYLGVFIINSYLLLFIKLYMDTYKYKRTNEPEAVANGVHKATKKVNKVD